MRKYCCLLLLVMWVLWTRSSGPTPDSWTAATGFASEEKCLASVKEKLDTWRQFKDAKFTKNAVTFTGNNSTLTYFCLPDSEDPRKRKVKEKS
ncbi:MAG: hypothetical protein HYU31_16675 [Deltaproteobacteria bacterium]|nr:hypothetical protein [Deltaproteobacteria bacterium]MBI2182439.1 hypothetical protein [Deltaproteobacteria bacterium]MBI2231691.1 hypothetical protein [Deltaproteobacteria bacterium]MBI2368091.1 hypothetical protein [Deltaproteobacteria bacterium]MBI2535206.1 hypothetical protein [Deltaproteobacteria bacterium]